MVEVWVLSSLILLCGVPAPDGGAAAAVAPKQALIDEVPEAVGPRALFGEWLLPFFLEFLALDCSNFRICLFLGVCMLLSLALGTQT